MTTPAALKTYVCLRNKTGSAESASALPEIATTTLVSWPDAGSGFPESPLLLLGNVRVIDLMTLDSDSLFKCIHNKLRVKSHDS